MKKILWKTIIPFVIGFFIFGCIILFNQLNIFATTLSGSNSTIFFVVWIFYITIFIFMLLPVFRLFALPKVMKRPSVDSTEEYKILFYSEYRKRILKSFKRNSGKNNIHTFANKEMIDNLENSHSPQTIKDSLFIIEKEMDRKVNIEIKKYAKAVFTSTTISQNGTLDAIFILKLQIELIWKIAHIYNQKPRLKEIFNIYVAVLANALAASAMSEISIQEIVDSFLRQFAGGLPSIFTKTLSKVADSVFDGTVNALLTLRVGNIAKDYCKYSVEYDEKISRKTSREKSLKMISEIGIRDIITSIFNKNKVEV